MAPKLPHREIGIRPGEKLHEVMVTEDDTRNTVEIDDRYIIEPAFHWWRRTSFAKEGAKQLPDGFRYASDSNTQWLDVDGINKMMREPAL